MNLNKNVKKNIRMVLNSYSVSFLIITFKYSLASCLCSSNICLDKSLLISGGAGLKLGSSIKCTESKSSWSTLLSNFTSSLPSKSSFAAFKCLNVEFVVLRTLPIEVRALLEVDATVFDLDSLLNSLSLLWLLAKIWRKKIKIY